MKFFAFTTLILVAACCATPIYDVVDVVPETYADPETFLSAFVGTEAPETTLLEKKDDSSHIKSAKQTVKKLAKDTAFAEHKHELDDISKNLETIETAHKGYNGSGGGAEDLASRVSTATKAISDGVKAMQDGLVSDHALGKTEIKALFDAINKQSDITDTEKGDVKAKAKTWCEMKQDYDTKKGDYDEKVSDRNGKDGSADTGLNTLKEIFGDTSVTSCSKASYPNTQCPDLAQCTNSDQFTVVTTLVTKLNDARKAYRLAQIAEADAKGPMDTAEGENTKAKNAFKQMIVDYVQSKYDECGGSKTDLYTTAKSAFSEQNQQRAKMYHALGQVQCHIQHIDNHDSTSKALTAQSVPATNGASATSAATCIAAMKTVQQIKDSKFTEYTDSGSVTGCKTKAELEKQISDYGNLQLTKDVWAPTFTSGGTCGKVSTTPTGSCTPQGSEQELSRNKPTTSSKTITYLSPASAYSSEQAVKSAAADHTCGPWRDPGQVSIKSGSWELYWQVDLEANKEVAKVQVRGFNEGDGPVPGYFKDVQVKVCTGDNSSCQNCGSPISATKGSELMTVECEGANGRYVRLENPGVEDGKDWHFCRVTVYGRNCS